MWFVTAVPENEYSTIDILYGKGKVKRKSSTESNKKDSKDSDKLLTQQFYLHLRTFLKTIMKRFMWSMHYF